MSEDPIRWHHFGAADRTRLAAVLAKILAGHRWIAAAYLYGSAARGKAARDLDVGLVAGDRVDHGGEVTAIGDEIAAALPLDAADLDLRILNGGDPVFLGNVLRDGVLLYEADREARIRFEVYALNLWFDFQPAWERVRERVLTRWSGG